MNLNSGINLHDISNLLKSKTGLSDTDVALFLKELFAVILEKLLYEDSVEIDSLGTFSINHIENEYEKSCYYLNFTPNSELIDSINKPFVNFEVTKLNEGVDLGDIRVVCKEDSISDIDIHGKSVLYIVPDKLEDVSTPDLEEGSLNIADEALAVANEEDDVISLSKEQVLDPIIDVEVIGDQKEDEEGITLDAYQKDDDTPLKLSPEAIDKPIGDSSRSKKRTSAIVLVAMLGVVITVTASAFFLWKKENFDPIKKGIVVSSDNNVRDAYISEEPDTLVVALKDSIENLSDTIQENLSYKSEAIVKPEVVTLAMGKTLRLKALEKYGHREFWVYIYLENKNKIANPNNVPVGVELTIAPKEKYGINANNPNSISKAIARGNEELSKFK